jgi:hypothetical protein
MTKWGNLCVDIKIGHDVGELNKGKQGFPKIMGLPFYMKCIIFGIA